MCRDNTDRSIAPGLPVILQNSRLFKHNKIASFFLLLDTFSQAVQGD